MTYHYTKVIQLLIWLAVVVNIMWPFGGAYTMVVNITGIALLIVHLAEYLFFYKTIHQLPESKPLAFVLTIIFGILYWRDFPNQR